MAKIKSSILVLSPDSGNGFDIGNAANSVAQFILPCKVSVLQAQAYSNTAVANSFTVTIGLTNANSAAGSIIVPDSTSANAVVVDTLDTPFTANAGDKLLVCVTEAGDSGEKGFVKLICQYESEIVPNMANVTESA